MKKNEINGMFTVWIFNFENKELRKYTKKNNQQTANDFIVDFPPGVYTSLRTVNNKKAIFQYSYHLNRLLESFQLSGFDFEFSLDALRDPLRAIISEEVAQELRIRIFIPFEKPNISYILSEELTQPSLHDYQIGVKVSTNQLNRENPRAKLTSFIKKSEKIKRACDENNLDESIMINKKGELLEGLSSNFFAVKNGVMFTAEDEVLKGSIREIIIEEVRKNKIPLRLKPILINELDMLDEAFITSTSRGILPVIQINDSVVGAGKPGIITQLLAQKLKERLFREAETI